MSCITWHGSQVEAVTNGARGKKEVLFHPWAFWSTTNQQGTAVVNSLTCSGSEAFVESMEYATPSLRYVVYKKEHRGRRPFLQ